MKTLLTGKSSVMKTARIFIERVAQAHTPVLLLGPTGSGKELMARAIHDSGERRDQPFIPINCASLNENLIESELFGHERGAFTGASSSAPGKFELAEGGTLFLDEVGELSLNLQAKLLRVLQEKEYFRLGGERLIKTNVRVIAATHQPLYDMAKRGTFREDLFYRLNVLSFALPPLKDRREDIPDLIELFREGTSKALGKAIDLAPETRRLLEKYDYPGNVRELHNILERLAVMVNGEVSIEPELLPLEVRDPSKLVLEPKFSFIEGLWKDSGINAAIEQMEVMIIMHAMEVTRFNQLKAAELLKLDRSTLRYKLKKYQLIESEAS